MEGSGKSDMLIGAGGRGPQVRASNVFPCEDGSTECLSKRIRNFEVKTFWEIVIMHHNSINI